MPALIYGGPVLVALLLALQASAGSLPALSGEALDGRELSLPAQLGGERAVVVFAFQREHQEALDACWPGVRAAAGAAGVPAWELMLLPQGLPGFLRSLIRKGMVEATPDAAHRARKVVVGADVDAVRAAVGMEAEQVHVAVVAADGEVAWLRAAPCDASLLAGLGEALAP